MTPAEILDGAIDVLHERGWCQGHLWKKDGRVCLRGALDVAAGHVNKAGRPYERSYSYYLDDELVGAMVVLDQVLHDRYRMGSIPAANDLCISHADEAIECLKLARERCP